MPTTKNANKKNAAPASIVVGANEYGKLPPQAQELEEAVLGALMLEREAYIIVADLLRPESFYNPKNRYIYEAVRSLAAKDQPIDLMTVVEKLKSLGTLEEAGGPAYIAELTRKVSSTAHLQYHAQIVAQKATARELIAMAARIENNAYDETQDVEQLMGAAEAEIFEISQRAQKRDVTQIDPVIQEAFARMARASKNEGNISGIPSGFHDLDKITSGWQKSDLVIIAARPAMGKSAFVLSMAKNMAVNYNIPVAIFSLEMPNVQLANRLLMNVCEIDGEKIKTGHFTHEETTRLSYKSNELFGKPIYLDDTPGLSVFELRSKARKLVREKGVKIIIIDYLQLMTASGMQFGSREQEVSIISRSLKGLAKELDIPIIALSQLNRGVEARTGLEGKKPQLSDLRESGAIEQDADMVCFIHRPEYYHIYSDESNNKDLRGLGEIIIAKHRNGAIGEVWLRFRSKFAKFQNEDEACDDSLPAPGEMSIRSSYRDNSDGAQLDNNNDFNPPF